MQQCLRLTLLFVILLGMTAATAPSATATPSAAPETIGAVTTAQANSYTIKITTLDDEWSLDANKASSKCSLREALQAAFSAINGDQGCKTYPSGPKEVTFTMLPGTYKLTRPDPLPTLIDMELTIDGKNAVIIDGNSGLKPQFTKNKCAVTFDPSQIKRPTGIFQINSTSRLNLFNITLQNGLRGYGGAIVNFGTLFINKATFKHNFAYNAGNYLTSGGAISSGGPLTVTQSTFEENLAWRGGAIEATGSTYMEESVFRGNRAYREGGALLTNSGSLQAHLLGIKLQENCVFNEDFGPSYDYTSDYHWGGALANTGVLLAEEVLFKDNWVEQGRGGGGLYNSGTLTLVNSVVTRNYSLSKNQWHITFGGGILNFGNLVMKGVSIHNNQAQYAAGIFNKSPGKIEMGNSTISQNTAVQAAGIANGWSLQPAGEIRLYHVTIANNKEESQYDGPAKGALAIQSEVEQSVSAGNSIISGQDGSACFKSIYTLGSNIFGGNCATVSTDPNVTPSKVVSGANQIQIFPLGNDGGPQVEDYYTHALFDQSIAVDVGADANCKHFLVADRDQLDQPRQGPCDAGAVEAAPILLSSTPPPATGWTSRFSN